MFDLSFFKLGVLALIALLVFGPNELPRIARQVGRALRDLRQIAEGAKADLREGLGPEFQDFDFDDLNPKRFVQKHLFEEPTPNAAAAPVGTMAAVKDSAQAATNGAAGSATATEGVVGKSAVATADAPPTVEVDDNPPFDFEAT